MASILIQQTIEIHDDGRITVSSPTWTVRRERGSRGIITSGDIAAIAAAFGGADAGTLAACDALAVSDAPAVEARSAEPTRGQAGHPMGVPPGEARIGGTPRPGEARIGGTPITLKDAHAALAKAVGVPFDRVQTIAGTALPERVLEVAVWVTAKRSRGEAMTNPCGLAASLLSRKN